MPYMSPAAIGWSVVNSRGRPFSRKCFPMARKEASGQPKPLEELTVTTAPSAIKEPISSMGMIFERVAIKRGINHSLEILGVKITEISPRTRDRVLVVGMLFHSLELRLTLATLPAPH